MHIHYYTLPNEFGQRNGLMAPEWLLWATLPSSQLPQTEGGGCIFGKKIGRRHQLLCDGEKNVFTIRNPKARRLNLCNLHDLCPGDDNNRYRKLPQLHAEEYIIMSHEAEPAVPVTPAKGLTHYQKQAKIRTGSGYHPRGNQIDTEERALCSHSGVASLNLYAPTWFQNGIKQAATKASRQSSAWNTFSENGFPSIYGLSPLKKLEEMRRHVHVMGFSHGGSTWGKGRVPDSCHSLQLPGGVRPPQQYHREDIFL